MRTWTRAEASHSCGLCKGLIAPGDPMLAITGVVKRSLIRCQGCAGPVPPDLPARTERHQTTKPLKPLARVATDWKLKQAGR